MAEGLRTGESAPVPGSVSPERLDALRRSRRLCFFAHYHPFGIVADHVVLYLRALAEAGFDVVVLSTADLSREEQARLEVECAMLVMRANIGLDFGGWMDAVRLLFPIEAELLLFANDSVYAPVGDLAAFIDRLTAAPADFYGAVESFEGAPHLQSWFLLFRPSAYRSAAFADLMSRRITPDMSKQAIIETFELGLTARLAAAGLRHHGAYRPAARGLIAARTPLNAAHLLWRQMIGMGVPFLKIELLRDNPAGITDTRDWSAVVDALSPALREAIADDLRRRGGSGAVGARWGWRSTLVEPNPVLWPELQPFLRRDFRTGPVTIAHRINRAGYEIASRAAWLARWAASRLR